MKFPSNWRTSASRSSSAESVQTSRVRASFSRSLSSTRVFLKKNLWAWPIIAVIVLTVVGSTIHSSIESTMRDNLQSQLKTLLRVEVAMLRTWFRVQESNAEAAANSAEMRNYFSQLADLQTSTSPAGSTEAAAIHRAVEQQLGSVMSSHRYIGYFIADKSHRILTAADPALIGQLEPDRLDDLLQTALDGRSTVSAPFPSIVPLKSASGRYRTDLPTMYVAAPIRGDDFTVMGVLGLQIRPEEKFTEILQLGRIGESGETYAVDADAQMVSNSRFDSDLMLLGLIPQEEDSRSLLTIQVRDPGGNMMDGYRPQLLRADMPVTRMAASVIAGNEDSDVDGYPDYRGVPVIGAWQWLQDYNIGIATEIDYAEAYRPLAILQWAFRGLFALLVASSIAIFIFTVIVARLQREAQAAAVEARNVGQYELLEKLVQGAMGMVYMGRHAMLQRPTAVKLLDLDKINDTTIARFEREVQITCQLNNPNTIAIYDYGRTPEGVFYYAMEYLDGITLQNLVDRAGPIPEGRVIHLLLQICGSLFEAHSRGLVHRDIKPANIMLNRRGGLPDVIKVLDFGLVKAVDAQKQSGMTAANSLTGTPLYISPEGVNSPSLVDHRSDIYAVGATGYFLLTGRPPFLSDNLVELLRMHSTEAPLPPSQRLGHQISRELEEALLACLEKNPANRPQTARELSNLLRQSPSFGEWKLEDGDAWWGRHERRQLVDSRESSDSIPAGQSGFDRTILSGDSEEP